MSENQLCWECKRACGECPWSARLRPIKGWVARKEKNGSYEISQCPLFLPDDKRRIYVSNLAKLVGKSINTLRYWGQARVKAAVKEKGYELFIEKPTDGVKKSCKYYIRKIDKNK